MKAAGVKRLVFSSTCATYGEPETTPIVETMRQEPVNPYGWSKWCVERVLRDYAAADKEFAFVRPALFQRGRRGGRRLAGRRSRPRDAPDSRAPAGGARQAGRRHRVRTDYPTPDGTCIRDYIHVEDLCAAHIVAMKALGAGRCAIL